MNLETAKNLYRHIAEALDPQTLLEPCEQCNGQGEIQVASQDGYGDYYQDVALCSNGLCRPNRGLFVPERADCFWRLVNYIGAAHFERHQDLDGNVWWAASVMEGDGEDAHWGLEQEDSNPLDALMRAIGITLGIEVLK